MQNFGAVNYEFRIGKYEVSLDRVRGVFERGGGDRHQWTLQRRAWATNDNIKGIMQNGSARAISLTRVIGSGKRPVTYVSWFDCGAVLQLAAQRVPERFAGTRARRNGGPTPWTGRPAVG